MFGRKEPVAADKDTTVASSQVANCPSTCLATPDCEPTVRPDVSSKSQRTSSAKESAPRSTAGTDKGENVGDVLDPEAGKKTPTRTTNQQPHGLQSQVTPSKGFTSPRAMTARARLRDAQQLLVASGDSESFPTLPADVNQPSSEASNRAPLPRNQAMPCGDSEETTARTGSQAVQTYTDDDIRKLEQELRAARSVNSLIPLHFLAMPVGNHDSATLCSQFTAPAGSRS